MTDEQTITISIKPSEHSGAGAYLVKLGDLKAAKWETDTSDPITYLATNSEGYLEARFCVSDHGGAWGNAKAWIGATHNGVETKIEFSFEYLIDKNLLKACVFENDLCYGDALIAEMSADDLKELLNVPICLPQMDYDGAISDWMMRECDEKTHYLIENLRRSSKEDNTILYIVTHLGDDFDLLDYLDLHDILADEIDANSAKHYLRRAVMTNEDYKKRYRGEKHIFAKKG